MTSHGLYIFFAEYRIIHYNISCVLKCKIREQISIRKCSFQLWTIIVERPINTSRYDEDVVLSVQYINELMLRQKRKNFMSRNLDKKDVECTNGKKLCFLNKLFFFSVTFQSRNRLDFFRS